MSVTNWATMSPTWQIPRCCSSLLNPKHLINPPLVRKAPVLNNKDRGLFDLVSISAAQLFSLIGGNKRIYDFIKIPVHKLFDLINGIAYTVVGDTPLRKVLILSLLSPVPTWLLRFSAISESCFRISSS